MKQSGIVNIVNLKVYNLVGGEYSQSQTTQPLFNTTTKEINLLDDTIYAQPDEILHIRFPVKDIAIRVQTPNKPSYT